MATTTLDQALVIREVYDSVNNALQVNVVAGGGGGGGGTTSSVSINDGTVLSQKATVTGAGALVVDASGTTLGTNISQYGGASTSLGAKSSASSIPVVLASDQAAIPASQSGTWNITNVSGTVSLPTGAATSAKQPAPGIPGTPSSDVITIQGMGGMTAVKVDGSAVTQPVSAASLPLPTGAATSALQSTANSTLATIATNTSNPTGYAQGSATSGQNGSLVMGAVTTSAPTYTTGQSSPLSLTTVGALRVDIGSSALTVNQGTANATPWNQNISQYGGTSTTLGQKTMSASMPVVLASDQSSLNVNNISGTVSLPTGAATAALQTTGNGFLSTIASNIGMSVKFFTRLDYTSTNVTTSAYVQLIASTANTISHMEIFDSSGSTMIIAVGSIGSEVDTVYVFPGGNGLIPVAVASGSRISIKAVSATANTGEIDINFYG